MKDNQKKLKKDHIMDMAKARFERFGYKKTTVDEISHDVRVSKKTIAFQRYPPELLRMWRILKKSFP